MCERLFAFVDWFCWIGRIQDYENVPMKKKDRFFLFSSSILFLPPALGEELIQLFHGICTLIIPVSDTFICLPHLSTTGAEQIGWNQLEFCTELQILDTLHSLRCQQFRTLFSVRKFWGERSKSRNFYTFNAHVQRYFPYADEGVHVSKTSVLSALLLIGRIAYFLTWCFFVSRMCSADPLKIKLFGREWAVDKEDVM